MCKRFMSITSSSYRLYLFFSFVPALRRLVFVRDDQEEASGGRLKSMQEACAEFEGWRPASR